MNFLPRFTEDERPIPDLPGSFEVLVDSIDEMRFGPFEIQSCGQHRLTCRWEGSRIEIDCIEVKDRRQWIVADGHSDKRVQFFAQLIRQHYATQRGQMLLRNECNAQDEAADDETEVMP